jgi:hypothetical protein
MVSVMASRENISIERLSVPPRLPEESSNVECVDIAALCSIVRGYIQVQRGCQLKTVPFVLLLSEVNKTQKNIAQSVITIIFIIIVIIIVIIIDMSGYGF